MRVSLAQVKYRTADFAYNYNSIVSVAETVDTDLLIFQKVVLEDLGVKDIVWDESGDAVKSVG